MKKLFVCIALSVMAVVNVFAIGTVNIGVRGNGTNTFVSVGYDFLTASFENSELWIEPRADILNCFIDNNDKSFGGGVGLSVANVYYNSGLFYGLDIDGTMSKLDDDSTVMGFSTGLRLGVKMYSFKFFGGLDKGFYHCNGGENRLEGWKNPWMLSIGGEVFF